MAPANVPAEVSFSVSVAPEPTVVSPRIVVVEPIKLPAVIVLPPV